MASVNRTAKNGTIVSDKMTQNFVEGAGITLTVTESSGRANIQVDNTYNGDPFGWGIVTTACAFAPIANTLALTANRGYFNRAVGYRSITKIGMEITNQAGNIDVGVYAGASGYNVPAARRASSGATACPAAAYAEVSLTTTAVMQAGDYLAVAVDGTPATFIVSSTSQTNSNIGKGMIYIASNNYVLPDPASSPVAARGATINLLGVP